MHRLRSSRLRQKSQFIEILLRFMFVLCLGDECHKDSRFRLDLSLYKFFHIVVLSSLHCLCRYCRFSPPKTRNEGVKNKEKDNANLRQRYN